jgi:transcriptional regulator with XRE-family HTH domain
MDESTTKQLENILSGIDTEKQMEAYLECPKITDHFQSFPEYYQSLEAVQTIGNSDLIAKSGLERSYYYQVMKGTRQPGRDKVLRLCLAAGLSLRETTRALELSGNAVLYARSRRDIILTVAVNQQASVIDTNLLLDKYGEEPLA